MNNPANNSIPVEHVPSPTDDVRQLIEELDAELNAAYSAEQRHGLDLAGIFRPQMMFFVARLDGRAVGCGGIAFDDGLAEVKRMYVRPAARGRGVAQAILKRLEEEARQRGMKQVFVETGDSQIAAMRAYEKAGYQKCAAFGAYANMPAERIVRSRFYEKGIG